MLLFKLIVLSKDIVIVEGFDSLGVFYHLLQPFINNILLQ
jgi:hypothetical protein